MEKELNSQKIKLEINSLEHLLLENVVERESTQIKDVRENLFPT